MRKDLAIICTSIIVWVTLIIWGCAQQTGVGMEESKTPAVTQSEMAAAQAEAKGIAEAKAQKQEAPPPGAALYEKEIKPLTPAECARCHYPIFSILKKGGGKHRFECVRCHQQFHRYNPNKQNWAQIMPKCQRCHGLPHGKEFGNCLECHKEPHAPKDIPFDVLTKEYTPKGAKKGMVACALCHKPFAAEMKSHPSAHNDVGCQGCHADKHGYIPDCMNCHEPHIQGQTMKDCLSCHAPHSPTDIKYAEETPNEICSACHKDIYDKLQTNRTKHTDLYCATCHTKHGLIPECQECHGLPHTANLHKKYPNCLDCHKDPHDLPVKHE